MIGLKTRHAVYRIISKVYPAFWKRLTNTFKNIRAVCISNDFHKFIYQISIIFLMRNNLEINRPRRYGYDREMIRCICNAKANDEFSSVSLLSKKSYRIWMMWFGYVERSTGWIAEVRKLNVVAEK